MSVKDTNITHKVWSRFHAKRKDGSVIKLRIQDHPWEEYKEDIVDYYMKYYVKDEAMYKAAGISDNEEAYIEYQELLFSYYDDHVPHVCICCIDDDSNTNDILGMSLLNVKNYKSDDDDDDDDDHDDDDDDDDDDEDFESKTKEVQNLFKILHVIYDIELPKGYENFYEGGGVSVRPDHRQMGIANEFIRLRKQICIDNNIQMSYAWMTSIGSQKAADKHNWKTFKEIPVEEFEKKTGFPFKADTPIFKLMYITKE